MRVVAEPLEELVDVRVDVGVDPHVVGPALELSRGRKLALEQQVRGLEEARLLGDLLDRVAAVAEDPLVAVDVRDRAPARCGVQVGGIERHQSRPVGARDLTEVGRPDGAVDDRKRVLGAVAVVDDGERLCVHQNPSLAVMGPVGVVCGPCQRTRMLSGLPITAWSIAAALPFEIAIDMFR